MYRIAIVILMILTCLLPLTAAAAEGTVPKAATMMAQQMDSQIMRRVGTYPEGRACVSIVSTVPVFGESGTVESLGSSDGGRGHALFCRSRLPG